MIEATDEFRTPPPGPLGRHWPFDPSLATIPDPEPIEDDDRTSYEVRLMHRGVGDVETTSLFYEHNPLDVEGWQGDNFPFTFNIADGLAFGLIWASLAVYSVDALRPRRVEGAA